jgi:DNA-binding transcriptional ArsR family regulator
VRNTLWTSPIGSTKAIHHNVRYYVRMADDQCDLLCLDLQTAERLRGRRLDTASADAAAGRAKGLADSTRLSLAVALLEVDELCVCDLAWIIERSENLVSHHMRALRSHGLVRSRRDGKMVMYSLTEPARGLLAAVLAPSSAETEGRARV